MSEERRRQISLAIFPVPGLPGAQTQLEAYRQTPDLDQRAEIVNSLVRIQDGRAAPESVQAIATLLDEETRGIFPYRPDSVRMLSAEVLVASLNAVSEAGADQASAFRSLKKISRYAVRQIDPSESPENKLNYALFHELRERLDEHDLDHDGFLQLMAELNSNMSHDLRFALMQQPDLVDLLARHYEHVRKPNLARFLRFRQRHLFEGTDEDEQESSILQQYLEEEEDKEDLDS